MTDRIQLTPFLLTLPLLILLCCAIQPVLAAETVRSRHAPARPSRAVSVVRTVSAAFEKLLSALGVTIPESQPSAPLFGLSSYEGALPDRGTGGQLSRVVVQAFQGAPTLMRSTVEDSGDAALASTLKAAVDGFFTSDPSIGSAGNVEHVPVEHRSASRRPSVPEMAHRAFLVADTTPSPLPTNSSLFRYVPKDYCLWGAVAVPPTTRLTCNNRSLNVTAYQLLALPVDVQSNCEFLSPNVPLQCVCSVDFKLMQPVFQPPMCIAQTLWCSPTIVGGPVCPEQPIDVPQTDPVCLQTSIDSSLNVTLNVTCSFRYYPDEAYKAFGIQVLPTDAFADNVYVTLPPLRGGLAGYSVDNSSIIPANGTYRQLELTSFNYVDESLDGKGSLRLTSSHPVRTNGTLFAQIYNFRLISDDSQLQQIPLAGAPPGLLAGRALTTFHVDLRFVARDMFAGGRLYLEAGLQSSYIGYGVAADRMLIDFTNYPTPPSPSPVSHTVAIVLGVLGGAAGIALLLLGAYAVRRWKQRKQIRLDKAEAEADDAELD